MRKDTFSRMGNVGIVMLLVFLALALAVIGVVSALPDARPAATGSKEIYHVGEVVVITLNVNDPENSELYITYGDNEYKFLGGLGPTVEFRPSKTGNYSVYLSKKDSGVMVEATSFVVINESGPEPDELRQQLISSDKSIYFLGESARIAFNMNPDPNYKMVIVYNNNQYEFLGAPQRTMTFTPKEVGDYLVNVEFNGVALARVRFSVIGRQGVVLRSPHSLPLGLGNLFRKDMQVVVKDHAARQAATRVLVTDQHGAQVDNVLEGDPYDVRVELVDAPVSTLTFKRLRVKAQLPIGVDRVQKEKAQVAGKDTLRAFAIDPSGLEFDNATVRGVAVGSEFYKCRDWDFPAQHCRGAWEKLMDIVPGEAYEFALSVEDPGYAEVGLATVNTNKSLYHVNESAEILMVVLDRNGYLVPEAHVELTVTSPVNITSFFSTNLGTIIPYGKGIYRAVFDETKVAGTYGMFVKASATGVDNNMSSYFWVREAYDFDIIRQTPMTVDPWQGSFLSNITLVSYIPIDSFSYEEVLPTNFSVTDAGGGREVVVNDTKKIVWDNLANNSMVGYRVQAPLVSPDLYLIGPGHVSYAGGGFTEARPWYLAIDPATDIGFKGNTSSLVNGSMVMLYGNYSLNTRQTNFFVWLEDDGKKVNLTSCAAGSADFRCVSSSVLEACTGTATGGGTNCTWFFTDCKNGESFRINFSIQACGANETLPSVNRLISGGTTGAVSFTRTVNITINDTYLPVKTIVAVDGDLLSPWATTNQTPRVNVTLSENGYCRMSDLNQSYAGMAGKVNCMGGGTTKLYCFWNGTALQMSNTTNLYVACSDMYNNADSAATNTVVPIQVLCDSQGDCPANQYCHTSQQCVDDVLTGYSCSGLAYGGGVDDAVCGGGASSAKCVNDTSYVFTGWYCSADATSCVYNDNGNSYPLTSRLCNSTGNDYKTCGASNIWGGWVYCGDLNQGTNQSATASSHPDGNCSYFASAQGCSSGLTGGCTGSATSCAGRVYLGSGTCGSSGADCDVGCGGQCDVDNNTTPGIVSDVCYYDKSCSAACIWQQSSEYAPVFCINDNDGGACAYSTRTNPTTAETCYWSRQCANTLGASLTSSGGLRSDYCDYCDASGNHNGGGAPAPTTPCASGCANSGTIYFDSGGTYGDRSNDCSAGTSLIVPDTLQTGDVWTGNAAAYCSDAECDTDCGVLLGLCAGGAAGVCQCTDNDLPMIWLERPPNGSWSNNRTVVFYFNATDPGSGLQNCSLIINGIFNKSKASPAEGVTLNFNESFTNGSYTWQVNCTDNSANFNKNGSEIRVFGVDTTMPVLSNPRISANITNINDVVCLNVSATDTFSGIKLVVANIVVPLHPAENITLYDNETTSCDHVNGDSIFSAEYSSTYVGLYNWSAAYANDSAGNMVMLMVGRTWNVSSAGNLSVTMTAPAANIRVNESDMMNYTFPMNCSARCLNGTENCSSVNLSTQYFRGSWIDMNPSSPDLIGQEESFACGNLTILGVACNHTFTIRTGTASGNYNYSVLCMGTGPNSPLVISLSKNVSVNDHPRANFSYPAAGQWLAGTVLLNASSSVDLDGLIMWFIFELDGVPGFGHPTVACSGSSPTCSLNTATQSQCVDSAMGCYLRVNVSDNDGLSNGTSIMVGIDNTGPSMVLDQPVNFTNITIGSYLLNATVADAGVGAISMVTFLYRLNDGAAWSQACADSDGASPFSCTWDIGGLGIGDGVGYQIKGYANDTLGNLGYNDTHANITIDRLPPNIRLVGPSDGNWSVLAVSFAFNVSDATSGIRNCSLVVNNVVNQTLYGVAQNRTTLFNASFSDGTYSWYINCTDSLGNQNKSETRAVHIDSTGPVVALDRPPDFALISGSSYLVNASVTDAGVGAISAVTFMYRYNSSSDWGVACVDDDGAAPYQCTWALDGLTDGTEYEVLAWANDSLGNMGANSSHLHITIDNYGPSIGLISPQDGDTDGDGNLVFYYVVDDLGSGVQGCALYFNGRLNKTQGGPLTEGLVYNFTLTNVTNGDYPWYVNCSDMFSPSHLNVSETRTITVDVQYVIAVNVSIDRGTWYVGNDAGELLNSTTNTSDVYGNPLAATVTTDIILGNTTYGWWNTSWERREPIFVTNGGGTNLVNVSITANITGLEGYLNNCPSEIRIATIGGSRVPSNVVGGDNATYCTVVFAGNVSVNTVNQLLFYAYFNNSAASNPNDGRIGYTNVTTYTYWDYASMGHSAYYDTSVSAKPPIGGPEVSGETVFTTLMYTQINASDGLRATSNSRDYRTHRFLMHATGNVSRIIGAYFYWYGYASSSSDVPINLYIWDFVNGQWINVGSHSTTTGDAAIAGSYTPGAPQYINASGYASLVAETQSHGGGATSFYTNFVYLNVTYDLSLRDTSAGGVERWMARNTSDSGVQGYVFFYDSLTGFLVGNYSIVSTATKPLYTAARNWTRLELLQDALPPEVHLNNPQPGSEVNTSVTFTYIVNDPLSTITNCSLYIDNEYESTRTLIVEGEVQYFFPRLPGMGQHNWSVNCTDYYGNTGASETWDVWVKPPDFYVSAGEVWFSDNSIIEGQNVTVFARVHNIGGSVAYNITVQFFDGDWQNGTLIQGNITLGNLTDSGGGHSNETVNVTWTPSIGGHMVWVVVDPPIATNGSIGEMNESNNAANVTYFVPSWHYYYGNATGAIVLSAVTNTSEYRWNISNGGNVFCVETGTQVSWTTLQAIGKNGTGFAAANDFAEIDGALNTSSANDSVYRVYTLNGVPKVTRDFVVFDRNISGVPITNSTNSSSFVTGILWDMSYPNPGEFNGSQNLVFLTTINANTWGKYGRYDYELRVPSRLRQYLEQSYNTVTFYTELK